MNSLVEGIIKKFCGRYLRNFNADNVEISLAGSVSLKNVEVNVDEIDDIQLPYKPATIFIGTLRVSLPLLLSTEFQVDAKDILCILSSNAHHDLFTSMDSHSIQRALQTLIGILYISLINTEKRANGVSEDGTIGGISDIELEYILRAANSFKLNMENVHIRTEEQYRSHIYASSLPHTRTMGDILALGFLVKRITFTSPTSRELYDDKQDKQESDSSKMHGSNGRVWKTDREYSQTYGSCVVINKYLKFDGISVYCCREASIEPDKHDFTLFDITTIYGEYGSTDINDESVISGYSGVDMSNAKSMDGGEDAGVGQVVDDALDRTFASQDSNNNRKKEERDGDATPDDASVETEADEEEEEERLRNTAPRKYGVHHTKVRARDDNRVLRLQYVQKQFRDRKEGIILKDLSWYLKISFVYQRLNQVFGPINLTSHLHNAQMQIDDEQVSYILHFASQLNRYLQSLQRRCLLATMRLSSNAGKIVDKDTSAVIGIDKSRRAKLRWRMIRNLVRKEWNHFAVRLEEGNMRWRSWFHEWRLAARYIALREILIFHVGFETIRDISEGAVDYVGYRVYETLVADQVPDDVLRVLADDIKNPQRAANDCTEATKVLNAKRQVHTIGAKPYRGLGGVSEGVLTAAENMIRIKLQERHRGGIRSGAGNATMALSMKAVRALYAYQLELDCILRPQVSSQCRFWADERFREQRHRQSTVPKGISLGEEMEDSDTNADKDEEVFATLLIGVADAVNLTAGSFGMTRLEAQCSVYSIVYHDEGSNSDNDSDNEQKTGSRRISNHNTKTSSAKVSPGTGTAYVKWGDVSQIDLVKAHGVCNGDDNGANGELFCEEVDLMVKCNSKGIFSPSYGSAILSMPQLLGQSYDHTQTLATYHSRLHPQEGTSPETEAYSSSINQSHMTLDTNHADFYSITKDAPNDRTIEKRVCCKDYSSTQQVSPKAVSLRCVSQVVVGTASQIAQAKSKFRLEVNTLCEERKASVELIQRAAERDRNKKSGKDGDSEDEMDENLILDPSILTVQELQINLVIPEDTSITYCLLYRAPDNYRVNAEMQGFRLADAHPVPLFKAGCRNIAIHIVASNNPWNIQGTAVWDQQYVHLAMPATIGGGDDDDNNNKKGGDESQEHSRRKRMMLQPVLFLPKLSTIFTVNQISTKGKRLSGARFLWFHSNLDESSFDWYAKSTCGPVSWEFTQSLSPFKVAPPLDRDRQGDPIATFKVALEESIGNHGHNDITSHGNGNAGGNTGFEHAATLWTNSDLLFHLHKPDIDKKATAAWSRGYSTSALNITGGAPPSMSTEAEVRLGGHYARFPTHRNIVTDFLGYIDHKPLDSTKTESGQSSSSDNKSTSNVKIDIGRNPPLPAQISTLVSNTYSRAMSTSVTFYADMMQLIRNEAQYDEDEEEEEEGKEEGEINVKGGLMEEVTDTEVSNAKTRQAKKSGGAGFWGLFGGGAVEKKEDDPTDLSADNSRNRFFKLQQNQWSKEKAEMQAKINRLESELATVNKQKQEM